MNILTDDLPTAVEIDGQEYAINTDFRAALHVMMAFADEALTAHEKQAVMLANLYPVMPHDPEEACRMAVKFLDEGEAQAEGDGEDKDGSGPRCFSWAKDANLIYAAFMQTHGIDLQAAHLHWWQFIALFMDLGADTAFCQLTSLRKRVFTGKATKEERTIAREMGDAFDIPQPDMRTDEEKEAEAEFMRLVEEGERARANRT